MADNDTDETPTPDGWGSVAAGDSDPRNHPAGMRRPADSKTDDAPWTWLR